MFDEVLAFAKVVTSAVKGEARALLLSLRGYSDGDVDDLAAERSQDEPAYGALGVFSRPRDPEGREHAEAVCARTDDGLLPVAMRDLRISRARGNVAKGAVGIAGYGGAFVSIDDAPQGTGSVLTAYVPFEHGEGGAPAKAHAVVIDSTTGNESILLVHALGHSVSLGADGAVTIRSADGSSFVVVSDDGVALSGGLKLVGNLSVGSEATADPVALAPPLVDLLKVGGPILATLANAVNSLAPGTIPAPDITALNAAVAFYVTPGAPLVQSPKLLAQRGPGP